MQDIIPLCMSPDKELKGVVGSSTQCQMLQKETQRHSSLWFLGARYAWQEIFFSSCCIAALYLQFVGNYQHSALGCVEGVWVRRTRSHWETSAKCFRKKFLQKENIWIIIVLFVCCFESRRTCCQPPQATYKYIVSSKNCSQKLLEKKLKNTFFQKHFLKLMLCEHI